MLNVIANLWGLNNGNGSVTASPIAKKKKRKNHHKKNKADVKITDVKNSISSSSNDDDDDDNDGDDNDNDIKIIAKKTTTTDDDIDDLYKADIKDVSHQIIEVVRALSKKDYRCINKDVSELFSGTYIILLLSFFII